MFMVTYNSNFHVVTLIELRFNCLQVILVTNKEREKSKSAHFLHFFLAPATIGN